MIYLRKYLPLLLVLLLFSGCTLFNAADKLAIEKVINALESPMSSADAQIFPDLPSLQDPEEPVSRNSSRAELIIGQWKKETKTITVNDVTATAFVKWTYPITASLTVDGNTKHLDLSLFAEGTYELTKNTDGTWQVTGFPRFTWKNKYGPTISDIKVQSGVPASISATIPILDTVNPLILVGSNNPKYGWFMHQVPESINTFSTSLLVPLSASKKHQGVITVLTFPKDESSLEYGITISYFETTVL